MLQPTEDQVSARVAEILGVGRDRVGADVALADLVYDSYRLVEMAVELQEDYDVIFSQDDLYTVTTVGDLTALVRARLS